MVDNGSEPHGAHSSLLVITGFMGTGKTTVGRRVAQMLGREFVDMDCVIEAREGRSISSIFEANGESYFRSLELALCAEIAGRSNLVVATGGGTLVDGRNRTALRNASIVCLDAEAETILARVGKSSRRPLLGGQVTRERISALLQARMDAYAKIENHVDTSGKDIDTVASEIAELACRNGHSPTDRNSLEAPGPGAVASLFTVRGETCSYPIHLGAGLLGQIGPCISSLETAPFSSHCAIVTNPRLRRLYAEQVDRSLQESGFRPYVFEIPEGEEWKTLDIVSHLYDRFGEAHLDRHSMVFALGGGVIGDTAGFAAATFLRGMPFVQLPTTLLSMVDASIGGKVAVDHARGKNLIGAFKSPIAVVADTRSLESLAEEEWRAGMAEVIKHAIVGDPVLFEILEERQRLLIGPNHAAIGGDWLERAIRVKVEIVSRDPYEKDERAKLNLGHTFAHAFEKLSSYKIRHGEAVAIGLLCAIRFAMHRGLCNDRVLERTRSLLTAYELPVSVPEGISSDAIYAQMFQDKKRMNGQLRLVLPRAIGDVTIVDDVEREEIIRALKSEK